MVEGAMPSREAVARSMISETARPPVCWSVATSSSSRQRFQFRDKAIGPVIEFIGIRIFERVLILGAAHAVVDRDVLHRLHEERDAIHFLQLRLQPADHIRGAGVAAIGQRLQVDRHAAAVERGVRAIGPDERRKTLHRWVLENDLGEFLLLLRHGLQTRWSREPAKYPE